MEVARLPLPPKAGGAAKRETESPRDTSKGVYVEPPYSDDFGYASGASDDDIPF